MRTRRYYFYRPIRPATPAEPAPTPETAPDRLLWLDPGVGVNARGAAAFNGSNQALSAASPAGLAPGSNPFWFGGWVRFAALGAPQSFVARDTFSSGTQRAYSINVPSSPIFRFAISNNGSAVTTVDATGFGPPAVNTWYFVLAYRSGSTIGISVNGGPFNTASFGGAVHPSTSPLLIGSGDGSLPLNGRADQVAYGASPTATLAQIRDALYNGGSGVAYSQLTSEQKAAFGLVSFWELDEPSGTRSDSHGANHLAPVNAPAAVDGVVEGPADLADPVCSWTDRVGALRFVEDEVGNRPARPSAGVLDFDGVNDRLSRPGAIVGNRPAFTMLARVRADALPASNPAVIFTESDAAANVVNRLAVTPAGQLVASYRPAGGTLATATSSGAILPGVEAVVGVRRDGASLQVFLGGIPSGPAAAIAPGTDLSGATARIGGPVESGGLAHFDGRVASLFAVGRALTDSQVAGLSGNL